MTEEEYDEEKEEFNGKDSIDREKEYIQESFDYSNEYDELINFLEKHTKKIKIGEGEYESQKNNGYGTTYETLYSIVTLTVEIEKAEYEKIKEELEKYDIVDSVEEVWEEEE